MRRCPYCPWFFQFYPNPLQLGMFVWERWSQTSREGYCVSLCESNMCVCVCLWGKGRYFVCVRVRVCVWDTERDWACVRKQVGSWVCQSSMIRELWSDTRVCWFEHQSDDTEWPRLTYTVCLFVYLRDWKGGDVEKPLCVNEEDPYLQRGSTRPCDLIILLVELCSKSQDGQTLSSCSSNHTPFS